MSELPKGWVSTEFNTVISSMTNGINGKQNKEGNGIPVSRIETISYQVVDFERVGYLSDYDEKKIEQYKLSANDILFSHINSPIHLGKTAIYNSEKVLYHGVNLLRVRLNEAIEPRFFNYYCKYIRALGVFSSQAQHAVNQSSLNQKKIGKFEIVLPPKNEQKRIADKLDSILAKVDRAQARLEKILGILKRFRQSVLAAATSGELTREWRGGADHNWPTVALADVGKGFNYGSSAKSQPEGDIPVLRMGNLQGGQLDWGDLVYTSDKAEIEKYLLENGDVLFNRTNSPELVGKTSIYRGERRAIYAGYLIRVKGSERLNTEFLNIQLNSPHARDYCWQVKTDGVSQSNINAKKLQAYEFDLPAIDEQLEIVRRVNELFSHAALFERQYLDAKRRFERLTQAVLAKAFRGELVEQNDTDEPADKLLERIKQQQLDTPKSVKKPRNTSKRAKNPAVHSAESSAELEQPQSGILSLLKNSKGELTVQQIIDQLSEKTFEQVDALFTELKRLLDSNLIIKVGAGEACAFKAVER